MRFVTVGWVLIVRFFWLQIASFSIPRNQKNCKKKNMQWIILHVTSPLLRKYSVCVLICSVRYNHIQLSIVEMSVHRYFKSKVNLLTPSQVQLSPNVIREVNQAVTEALECEELGNQASKVKSGSTMRLSCLRIALLLEGVAFPLGNLQSLETQSGLFSVMWAPSDIAPTFILSNGCVLVWSGWNVIWIWSVIYGVQTTISP